MYHVSTKDEKRLYWCRLQYATEIARHASAIVSTLSLDTRGHELDLAVKAFEHWYGRSDLGHFLALLADRLKTSGHIERAESVWARWRLETAKTPSQAARSGSAGKRAPAPVPSASTLDPALNNRLSRVAG